MGFPPALTVSKATSHKVRADYGQHTKPLFHSFTGNENRKFWTMERRCSTKPGY
ncbi:hypothetical protein HOLleu_38965 [Holothuria leucospilota]|uniref:Uncharacterized protein n=1 Tax=Holothuria leucospilota TaxID=206669 RepID=A0A9Q0YJL1_HOLLE|nr:hypothetical protein HOLleu_38965 [Holothuria leucospilota]